MEHWKVFTKAFNFTVEAETKAEAMNEAVKHTRDAITGIISLIDKHDMCCDCKHLYCEYEKGCPVPYYSECEAEADPEWNEEEEVYECDSYSMYDPFEYEDGKYNYMENKGID